MLPATVAQNFVTLTQVYMELPIEFPHLKAVTLAQWAEESGWGKSDLAKRHMNYGGAKWREYMREFAAPVMYAAHDDKTRYCSFASHEMYIRAYWARLDLEPAYEGWRDHTDTPESFLGFIGPIWFGVPGGEDAYVRRVLAIMKNRTQDLFEGA